MLPTSTDLPKETIEMTAAKTHLSLNVRDVERSVAFYEAFFGVPAHKRRPGYANFDLDSPALKLALQEREKETGAAINRFNLRVISEQEPDGGGALNHLGIVVSSTDDVSAAKERLEKAGLVTFSEENVLCCYAMQDKIWVRDPDGNAWEVYTLLDDMEDDHDHAPQACCG